MRLEKHHACQHVQYGNQNYLNNRCQHWAQCFWKAHAQVLNTHHTKTYVSVPLGRKNRRTLIYIYGNYLLQLIEPSGWKGFVTYGLGADTSLPHCLATGIWTLVEKATSGPKSRGASFGTTLWRHVQRYCSHFLLFMQIMCFEFCTGAGFLDRFPKQVSWPLFTIFLPHFKLKKFTKMSRWKSTTLPYNSLWKKPILPLFKIV